MENLNNNNQDIEFIIMEDSDDETNVHEVTEIELVKHFPNPNGNKITLNENIDGEKLRYIIDNSNLYEGQLIKTNSDDDWTLDRVVTILKKILRKCKDGVVKVSYKQNGKQGRYFGEGLQSIPRVVRHTISKDFYHDVDIKNAAPTFLAHYCKTKGLEHTHLKRYVSDRETYFTLLNVDRDTAKRLMLAIINGKRIITSGICPSTLL